MIKLLEILSSIIVRKARYDCYCSLINVPLWPSSIICKVRFH